LQITENTEKSHENHVDRVTTYQLVAYVVVITYLYCGPTINLGLYDTPEAHIDIECGSIDNELF
jgi:hypothetical protein